MGDYDSLVEVDHADVGGCRVGDVSPLAILRNIDGVGARVDPDGGHDSVRLRVNHADVAGAGVDHVDFVLFGVDGEAGRLDAYPQCFRQFKGAQVDDADRVALAVADVGVLAERGA